jgi:GNAT superfamily N-acetyltransferase
MAPEFRPGTSADSRACFDLFVESVSELGHRLGVETITGGAEAVEQLWPKRESLFAHLISGSDRWWVAEEDGHLLGYARSILRDGVRQLTEFFVRPGAQSAGLGGALLRHAFPAEQTRARILLATPDPRALTRYLKAGLLARFPVFHFHRSRRSLPAPSGLQAIPLSADQLEQVAVIDRQILGFRRDEDHRWLLSQREGYLYCKQEQAIGYGYVGLYSGPFVTLDPGVLGQMLTHAESAAPGDDFGVEVPLINRAAVGYLLEAGYRMDDFVNYFMSDVEIGSLDRYVVTAPSFFI